MAEPMIVQAAEGRACPARGPDGERAGPSNGGFWLELAWVADGVGHILRWDGARALGFIGQPYKNLLADQQVQDLLQRLGWPEYRWAVYGRRRELTEPVVDSDRIELCPPLQVDPKIARSRRVAHRRREAERSSWLPDRRNNAGA